jgi:hypothetical protein
VEKIICQIQKQFTYPPFVIVKLDIAVPVTTAVIFITPPPLNDTIGWDTKVPYGIKLLGNIIEFN